MSETTISKYYCINKQTNSVWVTFNPNPNSDDRDVIDSLIEEAKKDFPDSYMSDFMVLNCSGDNLSKKTGIVFKVSPSSIPEGYLKIEILNDEDKGVTK